MKLIKSIFNFLFFRWTKNYTLTIPPSEFLSDLKKDENKKKNIEGEITNSSFKLLFISDFALKFPAKIPLLEIKGEMVEKEGFWQLRIKSSILSFANYIIIFTCIIVLTIFFFDKYTNSGFGGISDSILPLIFPFFAYGLFMLIFLIESVSCTDYFSRLIQQAEGHKNDLK